MILVLQNLTTITDQNNMLAVRLPEELEMRLASLAQKTGRTKSFYARQAIEKHLNDLEDIYLAEKALEDIRAGRSKTISLEEMMKRVGLEDCVLR